MSDLLLQNQGTLVPLGWFHYKFPSTCNFTPYFIRFCICEKSTQSKSWSEPSLLVSELYFLNYSAPFTFIENWFQTNEVFTFQAFHAVTGRYTDRKELLRLPTYILSGKCLADLDIDLDWTGFKVTARSLGKHSEEGHIRTDHFLWFGKEDMQYF